MCTGQELVSHCIWRNERVKTKSYQLKSIAKFISVPPYPICSRYLLLGIRTEIVFQVFVSSVKISGYQYCPGALSCRSACDIFSKGSTSYALNSKSVIRYFCHLLPRDEVVRFVAFLSETSCGIFFIFPIRKDARKAKE